MADQTVTVKDFISRLPIAGAVVTIGGMSVTTDANGVAVFPSAPVAPTAAVPPGGKAVPFGSYTVSVSADWYFPSTVTFTGDTVEVDLVSYIAMGFVAGTLIVGVGLIVGTKIAGWW